MKTDTVAQKCSLIKKCVLRNFAKFTGEHLWQSLFLNKVADLRSKDREYVSSFNRTKSKLSIKKIPRNSSSTNLDCYPREFNERN